MTRLSSILVVVALVVAACGGGATPETQAPAPQQTAAPEEPAAPQETAAPGEDAAAEEDAVAFVVVGERIRFDVKELRVKAGQEVTVTFENRDSGVPHNFAVQGPQGIIKTDIANGPVTQTLTFTIDQPGTYQFICEVHPTSMVGELIVEG